MMTPITPPKACPECTSPITAFTEPKSGILTHWCENNICPGRMQDMLTFIADRDLLEIEGLGPDVARILAEGGFVYSVADLFEWAEDTRHAIQVGGEDKVLAALKKNYDLSGAAVLKIIETVERAKTAAWDRWIASFGIPMIGVRLGKVLAMARELSSEDIGVLDIKLEIKPEDKIAGIGPNKAAELNRVARDPAFTSVCRRLYEVGVRPTALVKPKVAAGSPLAGMAFLISGEMYGLGSREALIEKLVKLGAVNKSSVTKKVTHMIVGTDPGPSKVAKAKELNIPIYDETWLTNLFEENGVKSGGMDVEWA